MLAVWLAMADWTLLFVEILALAQGDHFKKLMDFKVTLALLLIVRNYEWMGKRFYEDGLQIFSWRLSDFSPDADGYFLVERMGSGGFRQL